MPRRFLPPIMLLALLILNLTPAMSADLLHCTAKDAMALQQDGTLAKDTGTKFWESDIYIIDTATGAVRMGNQPPVQWIVAQKGNDSNDTILVPPRDPDEQSNFGVEDLADAATDFIRIRQWKDSNAILFIRYGLDTIVSGTCVPIR
jgi:hypothetical protein